MDVIERIKSARSREELAEAVEPVALQLAVIAEETLPRIEGLWEGLERYGGDLRRLEGVLVDMRAMRRRWVLLGFVLALVTGVIAPATYTPLQGVMRALLQTDAQKQIESDAANWRWFRKRQQEITPAELETVKKILWQ